MSMEGMGVIPMENLLLVCLMGLVGKGLTMPLDSSYLPIPDVKLSSIGRRLLQNSIPESPNSPIFVDNRGICGTLNPECVAIDSSPTYVGGDYSISKLSDNFIGWESSWSSVASTSYRWVRFGVSQPQKFNGGVLQSWHDPFRVRDFEVWVGNDTVNAFPGMNVRCYKSTTFIPPSGNYPIGNFWLFKETFSCATNQSESFIWIAKTGFINNDHYFQFDSVKFYVESGIPPSDPNRCAVCPVNSTLSTTGTSGVCRCHPGLFYNGNVSTPSCAICLANAYCIGNQTFTECPRFFVSLAGSTKLSDCRCPSGRILSGGNCLSCTVQWEWFRVHRARIVPRVRPLSSPVPLAPIVPSLRPLWPALPTITVP
jgi:hypothetical protein